MVNYKTVTELLERVTNLRLIGLKSFHQYGNNDITIIIAESCFHVLTRTCELTFIYNDIESIVIQNTKNRTEPLIEVTRNVTYANGFKSTIEDKIKFTSYVPDFSPIVFEYVCASEVTR